jgi:hypothetical protein
MATEITISKEAREARERGRRVFAEIRPTLVSVPRPNGSYGKPTDLHEFQRNWGLASSPPAPARARPKLTAPCRD